MVFSNQNEITSIKCPLEHFPTTLDEVLVPLCFRNFNFA